MKIVFIDTCAIEYTIETPLIQPLGGTQSSVCYLAKNLALNHEVYLFCNYKTEHVNNGVKVYPLTKLDILDTVFPDFIVNINDLKLDISFIEKLKHHGCKVLTYYQHYLDQPPSINFNNVILKHLYDGYIFVSNFQKDAFKNKFDLDEHKCYVLLNGIPEPFEQMLLKNQKKEKIITYCSTPFRGLHLLCEIYPEIKKKHPELKLNVYSGMSLYQGENDATITSIFNTLKSIEGVTINDAISQTQLAKEMENVMILTYPNVFIETSCITVLQCMASGCIILTSNLGALPETTYNNNFLVDYDERDIETYKKNFIEKLDYILNNYDDMEDIIKRNKSYILQNHLWNSNSLKFIKICEDVNDRFNKYKFVLENMSKNDKNPILHYYSELIKMSYFNNKTDIYNYLLGCGISLYFIGNFSKNICRKREALEKFKEASFIMESEDALRNICLILRELDNSDELLQYLVKYNKYNFDYTLNSEITFHFMKKGYYNIHNMLANNLINLSVINYGVLNNYISYTEKYMIDKKSLYDLFIKLLNLTDLPVSDYNTIISNYFLGLLYIDNMTATECSDAIKHYGSMIKIDPKLVELGKNHKFKEHDKINIGYMIPNMKLHPCSYMISKIFKNYDKDKFNVCGIDYLKNKSTPAKFDEVNFIDITDKSDAEALNDILNLDLDILVDMSGHTNHSRISLLRCKPAKIIINYFAYPATYGIPEVDYKISDPHATPLGTEKYFVEKLLRMPNGFQCYEPPLNTEFKINKNFDYSTINFCCFNNPKKFNENAVKIFSKILTLVPNSKLYIYHVLFDCNHLIKSFLNKFVSYGVDLKQIVIGSLTVLEYLNKYNDMHIALDMFPYNGGTISHEALYMNTPLITMEGETYVSRVGVSLLRNLGLHELIAKNDNEYISIAVSLANNHDKLREYHTTIRSKMEKTDLLNGQTFTKHLEEKYIKVLNEYNSSKTLQNKE